MTPMGDRRLMFASDSAAAIFWRFMRLVSIPQDRAGCWEWRGTKALEGYGNFSVAGRTVRAHRWLYAQLNGETPDELVIRHRCDNPCCVNPLHLEVGTHADNCRDKMQRGRMPDRRGERHHGARLTESQVLEIRRRASTGETYRALGQEFGVVPAHVGKIVQRVSWGHL